MSLFVKSLGGGVLLCSTVILLSGLIGGMPWWAFAPLLGLTGVVLGKSGWQLPSFLAGFLSGLLVWGGMEGYYALSLHDIALHRLAAQFSLPVWLLIVGSGLTGGVVAGLALFTGKMIATGSTWNIYPD
ncbi:MAG TPA: hypothetical protein VK518_06365 [Puia sp.]|nr:hypothetical protein [Puia sp.]